MTQLAEKNYGAEVQDDFDQYMKEVRSHPLLTQEEELALAKRCAKGDKNAIRTMINSNLRLVVSIAWKYNGRGASLMDLIQEGSIGLVKAAEKYDHTKGARFSSYASQWIQQSIARYLLNNAGSIHIPRQKMEQIRKIMAASATIKQEGMEMDPQEISVRTGIPEETVAELLELLPTYVPLGAPAGGDADHDPLETLIEDTEASKPQEELVRTELKNTLETLLSKLDERQQQILRLHYGLPDGNEHSLSDIGKILGVSKERARQLEQQAFQKLRASGADLGLEEFLDD